AFGGSRGFCPPAVLLSRWPLPRLFGILSKVRQCFRRGGERGPPLGARVHAGFRRYTGVFVPPRRFSLRRRGRCFERPGYRG
ncbi:unnamed protein product, partial [Ectocarpus sp. 12 AP-2014]